MRSHTVANVIRPLQSVAISRLDIGVVRANVLCPHVYCLFHFILFLYIYDLIVAAKENIIIVCAHTACDIRTHMSIISQYVSIISTTQIHSARGIKLVRYTCALVRFQSVVQCSRALRVHSLASRR